MSNQWNNPPRNTSPPPPQQNNQSSQMQQMANIIPLISSLASGTSSPPPQQQNYPPQQTPYPPGQQMSYQGYPPQQTPYPPGQQMNYQGYPPQQTPYPPRQQINYQGYPPQQTLYPPGQQMSYQGYPPQQTPYPPGQQMNYQGYPPQQTPTPPTQPIATPRPSSQQTPTPPTQPIATPRPTLPKSPPKQTTNIKSVPSKHRLLKPIHCPPGLEYLLTVDQIFVRQKVEVLETISGLETNNQYDIVNSLGQKVYLANESTDACTRNCMGAWRPWNIIVTDQIQRQVLHLSRPPRCDNFCCFCCLQIVRVEAPPGYHIGSVVQDCSIVTPYYHIEDAMGVRVLDVAGPFCTQSIVCQDVEFDVYASGQSIKIGRISKQWSGLLRETFTDADLFGVSFPMDLDVRIKACLLAVTFLVDYMFFETGTGDKNPVDIPTQINKAMAPKDKSL